MTEIEMTLAGLACGGLLGLLLVLTLGRLMINRWYDKQERKLK
jgi:hypothetical protein